MNNIDLDKIRKMDDDSLKNYLSYLQNKNTTSCAKCYTPDAIYIIHIKQNSQYPSMRKACCLCEKCYLDLMDYLGKPPIEW